MQKRRMKLLEPEVRYFSKQIIEGCSYLHRNGIIHRDLKPGNLLLNYDMIVKIADFGLSTKVQSEDKNKTICGTANYMAPDLFTNAGYSYEVDAWAIGCIIYSLLIGETPFKINNIKEIYNTLMDSTYRYPLKLSDLTKEIIDELLHTDPVKRPTMDDLLEMGFFKEFTPVSLPISVLTTEPRFDCLSVNTHPIKEDLMKTIFIGGQNTDNNSQEPSIPPNGHLKDLRQQLETVLQTASIISNEERADPMRASLCPALAPVYWVSKWADYSDKYGLAYQLSDSSTGVVFVDDTRLILTENKQNIQYVDADNTEFLYTPATFPDHLRKKRTLLTYLEEYMQLNLATAGVNIMNGDKEAMIRLPYLQAWIRVEGAIALHLSVGTFQVNFFKDHSKLILCPVMGALTYLQGSDVFRTYRLADLKANGITEDFNEKLRHCSNIIQKMLK